MIPTTSLVESDRGRVVVYVPRHSRREDGVITKTSVYYSDDWTDPEGGQTDEYS